MKWAKTRSGCSARRSDYITPSAVTSRQSERLSRQRIGGRGGPICFIPSSLKDERAKDQFANLARLICGAHAATAAVFRTVLTWAGQDAQSRLNKPEWVMNDD